MPLTVTKKKQIIEKHHRHKKDTGSPEIQVAILTERINSLTQHLKSNVKDQNSRYGLIKMVGQRKSLLDYLRRVDPKSYQDLIARLELRK